ncbi:hypothetical protein MNBD_GAMMA12-3684 [hydrothermal vent metagenome]|uniref:Uncharacterized protein n=1 Tax=hydrothermal vent metagenome TaxID=652676 RepID=A0A3B0Z4L6_9ZZZZ
MNIKIMSLIILLVSTAANSHCRNLSVNYSSAGGSENITYLRLLTNGRYILTHHVWEPGAYDKKETYILKGLWSCSNNDLRLFYLNSTYYAKSLVIGKNPLHIKEATQVIHFSSFKDKDRSYLSNQQFYPVTE